MEGTSGPEGAPPGREKLAGLDGLKREGSTYACSSSKDFIVDVDVDNSTDGQL